MVASDSYLIFIFLQTSPPPDLPSPGEQDASTPAVANGKTVAAVSSPL